MEPFVFVPKTRQEVANFEQACAEAQCKELHSQRIFVFIKGNLGQARPGQRDVRCDKQPHYDLQLHLLTYNLVLPRHYCTDYNESFICFLVNIYISIRTDHRPPSKPSPGCWLERLPRH